MLRVSTRPKKHFQIFMVRVFWWPKKIFLGRVEILIITKFQNFLGSTLTIKNNLELLHVSWFEFRKIFQTKNSDSILLILTKTFQKRYGNHMAYIIIVAWECLVGYAILNTMKVILISQSQSEIKSLDQIKSGEFFYGLLHRRYVLTNAGINKILKNFDEGRRNKIVRILSIISNTRLISEKFHNSSFEPKFPIFWGSSIF